MHGTTNPSLDLWILDENFLQKFSLYSHPAALGKGDVFLV